jgi:hypothetical protein
MSNDPKRAAPAGLGANVEFRWHRLQSGRCGPTRLIQR